MQKLFMFPGQGSQNKQMLQGLQAKYNKELEQEFEKNQLTTNNFLESTVGIQLAIYTKQVSEVTEILQAGYSPNLVAGHSIGTFAAAVACGVMSFETGLELVSYRGKLMADAFPKDFGMAVIVGLRKDIIEEIVSLTNKSEYPVYLSNENAPLQFTVSGHNDGLKKVISLGKEKGASLAKQIDVPVPSHSVLMTEVASKLKEKMTEYSFFKPSCFYLMNHTGRATKNLADIKEDLAVNVMYPVLWDLISDITLERQIELSLEMSPGEALTNLLKNKQPHLRQISIQKVGIKGSLYLMNKWEGRE